MADLSCYDLPTDVLAKRLKNDLFDKLISCTSEQEVQDKLLTIIREKIDSGMIDPDSIRTLDSVGEAATLLYACTVNEEVANFKSASTTISNALQETIQFLCNLPTFELPEVSFRFPDLHEGIIDTLLNSLLQFAIQLLTNLMNELLEIIIDFCNQGASSLAFGAANLIDILEKSANNISRDVTEFIQTTFELFGISLDGTVATVEQLDPSVCIEDQITNNGRSVQNFLNDVSTMLTPSELCSLINKNPTNQTIDLINELIEFEYPNFRTVLNNKDRVTLLFSTLGRIVDPKICQQLENTTRNPNLCITEEADKIRYSLLANKGNNGDAPLTQEQIQIELEKERKRNKERFERVAETVIAIKKSPNSIFENAEKQLFCSNGKKGLISIKNIPVLVHSSNKVIDKAFSNVVSNFVKESNNIQNGFITNFRNLQLDNSGRIETIQKYINVEINGTTVKNTLNSEFIKATATYAPEYCDRNGRTDFTSLKNAGYEVIDDETTSIDISLTEADKDKRKSIRILKYININSLAVRYKNYIENVNYITYNSDNNSINIVYNTVNTENKEIVLNME